MPLVIRELHSASSSSALNDEWVTLENTGPNQINTAGCAVSVSRKGQKNGRVLGVLDPGFILKPGERARIICGSPAKKDQGTPPAEEEGLRNYHLFLKEPFLQKDDLTVRVLLKQHLFCSADFSSAQKAAP